MTSYRLFTTLHQRQADGSISGEPFAEAVLALETESKLKARRGLAVLYKAIAQQSNLAEVFKLSASAADLVPLDAWVEINGSKGFLSPAQLAS